MHTNHRRRIKKHHYVCGAHTGSMKWYRRESARRRRLWMKQLLRKGHYGTPCFRKHIRFDLS